MADARRKDAKLHKSYEAIEGGHVHHCLVDLTNGVSDEIDLSETDTTREDQWQKLRASFEAGYLLGCGSNPGRDTNVKDGVCFGHAYSILRVFEDEGRSIRLLQLRNPWGQVEWEGAWSDKSSQWTKYWKSRLDYVDKDDGVFWMSFEDFCVYFRIFYICRFMKHRVVHPSAWKGESATGFLDPEKGPQFVLKVSQPNTPVFVSLQQEDVRGSGAKSAAMNFFVVDPGNEAGRIGKGWYPDQVIPGGKGNGGCFTRMRESSGEVILPRADYAYVVICVTIKEGEEAQFSLSVLSNFEFSLDVLPFGKEAESLFTPRSEIIEEMEKSSKIEHSATGETLDVENLSEDNMDDGEESEDISI
eukprot:939624_1